MPKMSHLIFGLSEKTLEMVTALKKQGKVDVYVVDYQQSSKVKEQNGVVYLSPEAASFISKYSESIVYHHYMHKRPDLMQKKRRKDEEG